MCKKRPRSDMCTYVIGSKFADFRLKTHDFMCQMHRKTVYPNFFFQDGLYSSVGHALLYIGAKKQPRSDMCIYVIGTEFAEFRPKNHDFMSPMHRKTVYPNFVFPRWSI